MVSRAKRLRKAIDSPRNLRFDELCKLAEDFGFSLVGAKGSHHQYVHEGLQRPLTFTEAKGGKAKAYQVKQFLDALEELGLRDE